MSITYALNYGVDTDIVRIKGGESIISSEGVGTIILFAILMLTYIIRNRKDIKKKIEMIL